MTDATREQIYKDAREWADPNLGSAFHAGCTHQHPIAYEQGRLDGRDEVIATIEMHARFGVLHADVESPSSEDVVKKSMWEKLLLYLESLKPQTKEVSDNALTDANDTNVASMEKGSGMYFPERQIADLQQQLDAANKKIAELEQESVKSFEILQEKQLIIKSFNRIRILDEFEKLCKGHDYPYTILLSRVFDDLNIK